MSLVDAGDTAAAHTRDRLDMTNIDNKARDNASEQEMGKAFTDRDQVEGSR